MSRALPFLTAIVLVVGTGVVHGVRTERWSVSDDLRQAASLLQRVPMNVGDWEGRASELDKRQLEAAGIVGHIMRHYQNRKTGTGVSMLVVCGRPGRISVHTPDICFAGIGYEMTRSADRVSVPAGAGAGAEPAQLWCGDFSKQGAVVPSFLRIFWSWNGARAWRAPDNPRFAHAANHVLYKIYVIHETTVPAGRVDDDPGVSFLKALLPELDRDLAPAFTPSPGAATR
jgi:hypothetical protein